MVDLVGGPRSFLDACKAGDEDQAIQLLENAQRYFLEYRSPDGLTPLYSVALSGSLPVLQMLLQAGADVNAPIAIGRLPIHAAAKYAFSFSVIVVRINHSPNLCFLTIIAEGIQHVYETCCWLVRLWIHGT